MRRLVFFLLFAFAFRIVLSASEECVRLVTRLSDRCEAFEYASDRVLDNEVDKAEVTSQAERDQQTSLSQAFSRISNSKFSEDCCDVITQLNTSRCFCEEDVVQSLQSEISDELLAFTLFSAARAHPDGCGGLIYASFDEDECLLLGPSTESVRDRDCRSLRDELRSRRLLKGRFGLFEEALDSTGVLDEISSQSAFVLFALTDAAFRKFAREQKMSIAEVLEDEELLTDVLRRHVITGRNVEKLEQADGEVQTLQGSTVTVQRGRSGEFGVQGLIPLQEDVKVCRGTIHVVDGVFWPLSSVNEEPKEPEKPVKTEKECENIYEALVSREEAFGVLLEQINEVADIKRLLQGPDPVTLFAFASDEAQVEQNDEMIDLKASLERLIVKADFPSYSLVSGQRLRSISNEALDVEKSVKGTFINGVELTVVDIVSCNGRIHVASDPIPAQDTETAAAPRRDDEKQEQDNRREDEGTGKDEQDPCSCAEDGLSNGVRTGRPGCAQHVLQYKDNLLFCYLKDPDSCSNSERYDIYLSSRTPPAFYRICTRDEATFPIMNERIQDLDYLEHMQKYFSFARLEKQLSGNGPITLFVPTTDAIEKHFLEKLLDAEEDGEVQIRKLLRRHIYKGDLMYRELEGLRNITMSDGTVVSISKDSEDVVLDNLARIAQADIFSSNGVIHTMDGVLKPELIGTTRRADPCECVEEDDELPPGRLGCKRHVPDHDPFCYVKDSEACVIGVESDIFTGKKWRSCVDPCRCTATGLSGSTYTRQRGCAVHIPGNDPFCYVADPRRCKTSRKSGIYPGAGWKECGDSMRSRTSMGENSGDPCSCSKDGYSGEVRTGRVGCGRFNDPFASIKICYVVNPSRCLFSIPSFRHDGAAWRFC